MRIKRLKGPESEKVFRGENILLAFMTGRKTRALQVPPVVPYKALEKFSKALYGTTGGTYSARVFRPVMIKVAPREINGTEGENLGVGRDM